MFQVTSDHMLNSPTKKHYKHACLFKGESEIRLPKYNNIDKFVTEHSSLFHTKTSSTATSLARCH